jgi:hypothetical protein
MSVIPAIVAGVKEIVITTPPRYGTDAIDPAILLLLRLHVLMKFTSREAHKRSQLWPMAVKA